MALALCLGWLLLAVRCSRSREWGGELKALLPVFCVGALLVWEMGSFVALECGGVFRKRSLGGRFSTGTV